MKSTSLIDTHCHLDDSMYDEQGLDYIKIINSAYSDGISKMISICCNINEADKLLEMCKLFDFVYCSLGVHPLYVKESKIDDLNNILNHVSNSDFVAIGECGLDYYYCKNDKDKKLQKDFFIKQIEISIKLKKPLVIHCRDAFNEVYDILKKYKRKIKGVMHCYTGSYEMALKFIDLGFYISFSGILTFKNAKDLQATAEKLSLDNILAETDSPYLAPEPYRGKINTPNNLIFVLQKLAKLKKLPLEEVVLTLEANAKKLFNI